MIPDTQKFTDSVIEKIETEGPMVGVSTLLALELANLMHLSARQVPKERLVDYIHALSAHTLSLTTLIGGRLILQEIQSLPSELQAHTALTILLIGDEEGSRIERKQHERLTLIRDALAKDFPLTTPEESR